MQDDNGAPDGRNANLFYSSVSGGTFYVEVASTTASATTGEYVLSLAQNFSNSTTTLTDNGPNPSVLNQAVKFTANLSGGSVITGETVTLEDASNGNASVGSSTLSNGSTTIILCLTKDHGVTWNFVPDCASTVPVNTTPCVQSSKRVTGGALQIVLLLSPGDPGAAGF